MSTRKHYNEYDVLTEAWILIKVLLKMSPKGAALLTAEINTRAVVPLLRSSFFVLYLCTQGSISGFALISPWAMKSIALTGLCYDDNHQNKYDVLVSVSTSHSNEIKKLVLKPKFQRKHT